MGCSLQRNTCELVLDEVGKTKRINTENSLRKKDESEAQERQNTASQYFLLEKSKLDEGRREEDEDFRFTRLCSAAPGKDERRSVSLDERVSVGYVCRRDHKRCRLVAGKVDLSDTP